jgi:hypothetical protein
LECVFVFDLKKYISWYIWYKCDNCYLFIYFFNIFFKIFCALNYLLMPLEINLGGTPSTLYIPWNIHVILKIMSQNLKVCLKIREKYKFLPWVLLTFHLAPLVSIFFSIKVSCFCYFLNQILRLIKELTKKMWQKYLIKRPKQSTFIDIYIYRIEGLIEKQAKLMVLTCIFPKKLYFKTQIEVGVKIRVRITGSGRIKTRV